MKIAEIKEMSTADLAERIEAEVVNYNQTVINHAISPLENPAQIKQLRRTIARMKTELRERELNNNNDPHGSKKFKKRKNRCCIEQ